MSAERVAASSDGIERLHPMAQAGEARRVAGAGFTEPEHEDPHGRNRQ
jgi:hypothetical protein